MKISELKIGDKEIDITLKFKEIDYKTAQSGEYADIKATDGIQTINVKYWGIDETMKQRLCANEIYDVKVNVKEYKGIKQLEIKEAIEADLSRIDISEFEILPPIDLGQIKREILEYVSRIKYTPLSDLVIELLKDNQEKYFTHQAAVAMHHAYKGGLAYHTLSMLKIASGIIKVYEFLDSDLIYSGIILHDLGKIFEMRLNEKNVFDYTKEGSLIGHITITYKMIVEVSKKMKIEDDSVVLKLLHIILSHHGKLEYGSPVLPQTLEAFVVSAIDNIDSKIGAILKAIESAGEAEKTEPIQALDKKSFYI